MPIETFCTVVYTCVDARYQTADTRLLARKVGSNPEFSDSEVMALALVQHGCGFSTSAALARCVAFSQTRNRRRKKRWSAGQPIGAGARKMLQQVDERVSGN